MGSQVINQKKEEKELPLFRKGKYMYIYIYIYMVDIMDIMVIYVRI